MTPPDLRGFTYLDLLGSGGFADVYLYEQLLPRRRVAVKVLLTDRISTTSVDEFTAEANVMAMLSTHPAIVTIYQAGVADDGRPYLVMEYCPKPNLQVRYRRERFSVAESLRVGIQVAAAVETAHRAGVLHRDIKPANILVTEYNRPALTDFGIASTTSAAAESAGLSIPWSPPESFADEPRSDPRSDVWALGATVYSLLAGRSPFELEGQRNNGADLIQRIETMAVAPLDRPDSPASLQHALERAMSKSSADRYDSALAFARALQTVQIELSHSVTPIDILDDHLEAGAPVDEDDGLTRVRGVVSISPETAPAAGQTRPNAATTQVVPDVGPKVEPTEPDGSATVLRAQIDDTRRSDSGAGAHISARSNAIEVATEAGATIRRAPAHVPPAADDRVPAAVPAPSTAASAPTRRRTALWATLGAVAAAAVIGVVLAISLSGLLNSAPTASPAPTAAETAEPMNPIAGGVSAPTGLSGTATAEGVLFTWQNPNPADGDRYAWGLVTRADEEPALQQVDAPTVTVPADPSGQTCIEVLIVRTSGQYSDPVRECVP
ncbi:MAG: protein kinase [Microbacterium pygmaeum]